ncbi:hypothetical protein [Paenibacillus sp. HB172176]|uniref:hypothetical protein n=1 Tax=Paenibacillus sp. HB172176 TaxID=2493690 RepID=UPI001438E49B|nr:hypothetical protein [Paenibacillus sp. HB172176]
MKVWTLAAAAALLIAMLAGCSNAKEQGNSNAATNLSAQNGAQTGNQSGIGNGNSLGDVSAGREGGFQGGGRVGFGGMTDENGNAASLMGKVKSMNVNTITVYKSSFTPGSGAPANRGNRQSQPPSQAGDAGAQPPSSSNQAVPGQSGDGTERPSGGFGGAANMFSDETEDITLSESTIIQAMTMGEDGMIYGDVAATDLKIDDVLTIWLKADSFEATRIIVGGMSGYGGRGGN